MAATEYRKCTWFHGFHTIKCIKGDLCDQRQIPVCPFRTGFAQGMNEPDEDFDFFCRISLVEITSLEEIYDC